MQFFLVQHNHNWLLRQVWEYVYKRNLSTLKKIQITPSITTSFCICHLTLPAASMPWDYFLDLWSPEENCFTFTLLLSLHKFIYYKTYKNVKWAHANVIQWQVLILKYILQLLLIHTIPIFYITFTKQKVGKMFCYSWKQNQTSHIFCPPNPQIRYIIYLAHV